METRKRFFVGRVGGVRFVVWLLEHEQVNFVDDHCVSSIAVDYCEIDTGVVVFSTDDYRQWIKGR